jgi:hypothetical protein
MQANPLLVFATSKALYDPRISAVSYPPGPTYSFFAGLRLWQEFRTEGIYSGLHTDEGPQLTLESRVLPAGSLLLCKSEFNACAGLRDGRYYQDVWFAMTPEEQNQQNLQRGCGMVLPQGEAFLSVKANRPISMVHDFSRAVGMMAMWPEACRKTHLDDIRALSIVMASRSPR